ncbi:MAG: LamG-like jellyroll fold domain-containing protein [Thermoguttaceae bacterium]
MAASELQFDDLSPLLAALCEGTISDEDFLRLQQVLAASACARQWYINYMDLQGELYCGQVLNHQAERREETGEGEWTASGFPWTEDACPLSPILNEYAVHRPSPLSDPRDLSSDEERQEVVDTQPPSDGGFPARCVRQIVVGLSHEGVSPWLAAVAVFSLIVFGISRWEHSSSFPVAVNDAPPPPTAWICLLHNVQWANDQHPYGWGGAVTAGNTLKVKAGLVRLVFSSGAEVLLEGPVAFSAETAESGRLRRGKLVVRAETDQARGFTIRTPTAQIVDLGTEFGVTVDEQGQTETHVFAGQVLAQVIGVKRAASEPVRLTAGQAARVESRSASFQRLAAVPETFVRQPPPRQLNPILHHAMEESAGPLVDRQGGHRAKGNGAGGLLYRQPGVTPGTYGALSIGPGGTGFSAGLSNAACQWNLDTAGSARLNLVNNFTVMAWLYLPDTPSGVVKFVGQSSVSPTRGWALGVREAAVGRGIHFSSNGIGDFYSGVSIPWTGGQWHHIAVSKSSAEGIKFYLDGRLVATDNRPTARDDCHLLAANESYSLGRGNDYVKEPRNGRRIDEFRVYDTVLTREEIIAAASVP